MAFNLEITEHADQLIEHLTGYLIQKLDNVGAALHLMDTWHFQMREIISNEPGLLPTR